MDFFNSIKIISLPKWLIAFMAALISSIFLFSFWLIYVGVILKLNESEITVAAISLIGTILPIIRRTNSLKMRYRLGENQSAKATA